MSTIVTVYDHRVTSLIGRQREFDVLDRLATVAAAGAGGMLVIEGEAGLGKTSLLDAFAADVVTRHGALVLRGRAWEEGGAPPYWPWHEIADAGGWKVGWDSFDDPFALYSAVLATARAAARAAGQRTNGPLVLIIDDLHAADDDTIRLTRYIARSITDAPIALVVAARPSTRLSVLSRLGSTLSLTTLDDGDADSLIESLAHGTLSARTLAGIRTAAEGNPLFLAELARSALTGRAIPSDIVSVVTPVLERQSPAARSLVEMAAVLGRGFPAERLAAVSGRSLLDVLHAIEPLRLGGILTIDGTPPTATFSHQLVRDVLYSGLAPARRLELHAKVVDAFDPEALDTLAERAHHLLAAVPLVERSIAVAGARRAAAHATSLMAYADAAALLRRASELADEPTERHELLMRLGANLRDAGRVNEASTVFSTAIDVSRDSGDVVAFAHAVLSRTERVGWDIGAAALVPLTTEALLALHRHVPGARPLGVATDESPDLQVRLRARRATLLAKATNLEPALHEARAALRAAQELGGGHDEALADALAAMHTCCRGPDELEESLAVSTTLLEVATRLDQNDRLSEALLATLADRLRIGDIPSADVVLEQYTELAARSRRPRHEFLLLSRRAMRAFLAGRLAEGDRLIERAHELGERIEDPDAMQVYNGARSVLIDQLQGPEETLAVAQTAREMAQVGEPRVFAYAAYSYLRAGATEQAHAALAALVAAIPVLTIRSIPLLELCLVAEVASVLGPPETVEQLWATLEGYGGHVVSSGSVSFGGVVDEYLGMLAFARGRPVSSIQHLRAAADRYGALGARVFEQRASRRLQQLATLPTSATTPEEPIAGMFRRRDDAWEIGLNSHVAILRDARGLQHLHMLLRHPGKEIGATELVGVHAGELAAREAHHALLDDTAKAAYRQRIRDLQEDLDEADAASDMERSSRLRAELDLLLDELRRAVGLFGRDRNSGAVGERARVTVRKAIAASIQRLDEHDPRLAALLRATITTGHQCCYEPNPLAQAQWTLS